MALPINNNELIHGNTIEWERLEFKKGWNPEEVIRSMCAFANDINNWGGGYIIIGIAEIDGQPILPPFGLQQNQLDAIQGEIVNLSHRILPNYYPITQPYQLEGQHILVLWCPAGDNRPYTAPVTLGKGAQRQCFVRIGSRSIIAEGENLRRLQSLAARIPFDDRVNNKAKLDDLDLGLIQAYLQEVKSGLFEESTRMAFPDLCRTMLIAKGPNEDIRPVNAGLLFFSKEPERFFSRSWIELVWHQSGTGKEFKEFYFKGPLHQQLRNTLSFIKTNIISEQVIKHADKAEAERFFNFPYNAVEEALANAVYHKSYELGSPVEVQLWPDKIEILSYPGPVPPVNATVLKTHRRIVAREYRNRRIGDFLKELHLTEGRGTGFPSIYQAMTDNGSPSPIFEADESSTYVLVILPAHSRITNGATNGANSLLFNDIEELNVYATAASNVASNVAQTQSGKPAIIIISSEMHDRVVEILEHLTSRMKRSELFERMELTNQSYNRAKYLDPILEVGWIKEEFPQVKTHPNQTYLITEAGKRILELLSK